MLARSTAKSPHYTLLRLTSSSPRRFLSNWMGLCQHIICPKVHRKEKSEALCTGNHTYPSYCMGLFGSFGKSVDRDRDPNILYSFLLKWYPEIWGTPRFLETIKPSCKGRNQALSSALKISTQSPRPTLPHQKKRKKNDTETVHPSRQTLDPETEDTVWLSIYLKPQTLRPPKKPKESQKSPKSPKV